MTQKQKKKITHLACFKWITSCNHNYNQTYSNLTKDIWSFFISYLFVYYNILVDTACFYIINDSGFKFGHLSNTALDAIIVYNWFQCTLNKQDTCVN